jgi:uncharacterized membrane protein (UPF0127 family)
MIIMQAFRFPHRLRWISPRSLAAACVLAAATFFLTLVLVAPSTQAASVLEPLIIETANGPKVYQVEVMRTDAERERGLMLRPFMPADRAMLFDFGKVDKVAMWMKDTLILLDMLYIRKDGTISRITAMAEPMSERILPSGEPVLGVLEINGGQAAHFGIKEGDVVRHKLFGNVK